MQDLNINISAESASSSPHPIKRTREHDENRDPSPKKLKIDFSAAVSPADSPKKKVGLPKRLFATEQVPDSETSTTITDIADRLGITAPNLELLIAHGVDVHHIDRRELLSQAKQLQFSESEMKELFCLSDDQLLAQVSLTAKLAQSGVPSHVLGAARTYRKQGVIVKLSHMLKAQRSSMLSSLQGAERWRQLLELPDKLFPSGWNATQENADRHFYLICKALIREMPITDIEVLIMHDQLQKAVEYMEAPWTLNLSSEHIERLQTGFLLPWSLNLFSEHIERLSQTGFLLKFIVNILAYDMPLRILELGTPYAICNNWRTAKRLGFSTHALLKNLDNYQLELFIVAGKKARLANVPAFIIERVTHASELNEFLALYETGFPFNDKLLMQMRQTVPEPSLQYISTLCHQVRLKLEPKLNPPEKFDELLLQYHRLCQYGFNLTQIGLIGRRAAKVLEGFEGRCHRVYKPAELGAILKAVQVGWDVGNLWPTLDLIQNTPWIESELSGIQNVYWIDNITLFSSFMGKIKNIEDSDRAVLRQLFLAGIHAQVLKTNILNADYSLREDVKANLALLQRVIDGLLKLHVSPPQIANESSLQGLQDCLLSHQNAENQIQNYSKYWNTNNDTWELKSDPSITVSRPHLEEAIRTAFQVHRTVTVPTKGWDTVVEVGPNKSGGNKLALRSRLNIIEPIYISSQVLGQGTFGVVHKAVTVAGKVIAAKSARLHQNDIFSEYRTLRSIYDMEKSITGLQPPPLGAISVSNATSLSFFSIMNELFSHNLQEEIYGKPDYSNQPVTQLIPHRNVPHIANEYFNVLIQLAKGLAYLHSHNFSHQDIKPGNMGVQLSTRSVFHIDLGSAQSTIIKKGDRFDLIAPTRWYTQGADVVECNRAAEAGNCERYKLVVEKIDVYGTGISFYEFLAKSLPFTGLKGRAYPDPRNFDFNRQALQANHVPDSIINLVADMIQFEPEKRPSAAEVVERLEKIGSEIIVEAV